MFNKQIIFFAIIFLAQVTPANEPQAFSNLQLSVSIKSDQLSIDQASYLALLEDYVSEPDSSWSEVQSDISPQVCYMLAFFPGFFAHGLGHFYIGENWTGAALLTIEVVSVIMFYRGTIFSLGQMDSSNKSNKGSNVVDWGAGLFFGSWIYDWAVATIKASKMQKSHSAMIYPSIEQKQVSINFAFSLK